MNANRNFDEEDLAFYVMHLLAEQEASMVAQGVREDEETRGMLADVQERLGAYAEAEVELRAVPAGSLDRLLAKIATEKQVLAMPVSAPAKPEPVRRPSAAGKVLPWIGWGVAAGMTVAAGKLYEDRMGLHRMLTAQTGQVVHMSADTMDVYRQRDALQADLAERAKVLEALRGQVTSATGAQASLQSQLAAEAARRSEQTAKLNGESARANDQAAQAASAAQERDALRGTVAAQANQVARLSADEERARQVLDALNDPTALRVTLTKPKSNPIPTGRATYVAGRGTLVFLANNLAPLKQSKVYQLWLLPAASGAKPVPVGTFTPDARGAASVVAAHLSGAVAAKGFAVTIENAGGSQTPTLPLLLAGS